MENLLLVLPCLSAQLELYPDHVIFRPVGSWAGVVRMVEQAIPLKEIESVRLMASSPLVNGVLEIKRRDMTPKSIFVIYAHSHALEARTFYETLDDLMTRKGVLDTLRTLETS